MVRFATYNPLASDQDRLCEISAELRTWDCVLVCGTQQRAEIDHPTTQVQFDNHWGIKFGRGTGSKHTNRSCGLAILLGCRFPRTALKEVCCPPKILQGRVGAVRLQTSQEDLLL
eukprot:4280734-Pyramimonas_sp.AAC.1